MNYKETLNFTSKNNINYQVKQITHDDKNLIEDGFFKLSNESIIFRFLELKKKLSDKELEYLSSTDGINHVAFGAGVIENEKPIGIAIARYIKISPDSAEVAVTVIDKFQNQGIGKNLIKILMQHAKDNHLKFLLGTVNCYNHSMVNILKKYPKVEFKVESSNYLVTFDLNNLGLRIK